MVTRYDLIFFAHAIDMKRGENALWYYFHVHLVIGGGGDGGLVEGVGGEPQWGGSICVYVPTLVVASMTIYSVCGWASSALSSLVSQPILCAGAATCTVSSESLSRRSQRSARI